MSTSATHYTKLYPKQGNLTSSPNQAYNLLPAKYFDHILGGIGAGTIAALATVAPGSYNLSYIDAPQVHTDLSGNFIGFVGNASNKIGEFSCIHIHKDAFGLFQIIDYNVNVAEAMPGHSSTVTPFALDLLTNTEWKNSSDAIIGVLFPRFFIVYFGQDFPKGNISLDNIKVNFAKLGAGYYSLWISTAAEAIKKRKTSVKSLAQRPRTLATPKQTSSSPTSSPTTTHPNPYLLLLDHTASSPLLIQTSSQLRQTSYNFFYPSLDHFPTSRCALELEHFDSTTTK
jgi:hypothetical protein